MTSWPWMKGIETAVADPIPPVCPEDDRPAVKDLIEQHRAKIDKIKQAVKEHSLYNPVKHDDLWILRFWLSHKKSKAAIDAAKYTLEFRSEHGLDDKDIREVAPHRVKEGKVYDFIACWKQDAMVFTHPDPQRGVIVFLKLKSMDQHFIVEKLDESYWLPAYGYSTEWAFQWLDYTTRTTGRLTKSVRFIDADGFGLADFNRECIARDGKYMGLMEDCYPQLLDAIFVCNPPSVINILWKIVKVVMPRRVVDKFDIVDPKGKPKDRQKMHRHISEEMLPAYYGGKNPKLPTEF